MAIHFILQIVVHLLQCLLYVAFGLDAPSVFEILLFELVIEIIKNCTVRQLATSESEIETPVSSQSIFVTNVDSAIPVVHSIAVYRFCQALELKAILAPTNEFNPDLIQFKPRKVKKITPVPIVYSVIMLKMCEALDLKAELRPENQRPAIVSKKKRQAPMVHSPMTFAFANHCNSMHS
ncbi:hypothetical protein TNCT_367821 [Trichonephila clavata]|uniref:Uncharacterized protein n=1 Tax=Trichonephila clavata TaxID=2740835 RepID=A0A8X6HI98_TRICU|nr:hypothetical protein TNCT_367821 [Trichonephila clavata]